MRKRKVKQEGFTFVEALVGMTITGVVLIGVITVQISNYKSSEKNKDILFAQAKTIQMIEELRSVVRRGESALTTLDTYDDKSLFSPILTTDDIQGANVDTKAGSQISSNIKNSSTNNWKFIRQIKVRKSQDDPKSRNVSVSVYYEDSMGNAVNPPLATLSTILSTSYGANLPSQVMDSYGLAIHNEPGWWASLATLKQSIQDAAYDLKVKNPGLDYRFHFITRSSFGRDPYYTPYINKTFQTKDDTNIKFPYAYNGRIEDTSNGNKDTYYYNPNDIQADGMRINIDNTAIYNTWYGNAGGETSPVGSNSSETLANPLVYSAADEFNNAVRGPEDQAINDKFKKTLTDQHHPEKYEPTYRKLLDDMLDSDSIKEDGTSNDDPIHRNLMITNLHGELFPCIPLRNYSDAAKDPIGNETTKTITSDALVAGSNTSSKYKRVVTHPEQLEYSIPADASTTYAPAKERKVYLRVYPYLSDPTQAGYDKIDTVSLFIPTKNFVGSNTTSTQNQTLDNMPNFTISPTSTMNSATIIAQIKEKIKLQYIDDDFVKRSDNYVGYVKINNTKKGASATPFYPIGAIVSIGGYNFKIVAKRSGASDVYTKSAVQIASGAGTDSGNIYKVVSCDLDKPATLITPSAISSFTPLVGASFSNVDTANTAGTWTGDISMVPAGTSNANYTTLGLSATTANIHSVYEGTYEIIVNPTFDRMATGSKTMVPGILIKLHGTGTKNITKDSVGGTGGIPTTARLYGLDYIPAPLGSGMWRNVGAPAQGFPTKGVNGAAYYTDTLLDTISGATTSNKLGSTYGNYTGLAGKDLDSWGANAKNTARWIISMNVGYDNSPNANPNILSGFQNKMMSVETRIGSNLNTGFSINQSPNPYDGTVDQTALTSTDYVAVNDMSIEAVPSTALGNGTYSCADGVGDCGYTPYTILQSTNTSTTSNSNKNNLSNLSRTYVWIGSGSQIQKTERYQMTGDIRYNPYIDTLEKDRANNNFNLGSDTAGRGSSLVAANYPMLGALGSIKLAGSVSNLDVPRFFEMFKKSLINTNSIYNSLVGWSFYYYAIGGEVGSNGTSVNFNLKGIPYNSPTAGTIGEAGGELYNEILEDHASTKIIGNNNQTWGAIPWIGELYKDDNFGSYSDANTTTEWSNLGNLPAATTGLPSTSASYFSRQSYTTSFSSINSDWVTKIPYTSTQPRRRLKGDGVKIFFHGSADGVTGTFQHNSMTATGNLTPTGKELVGNYGLILADSTDVPRGFNFSGTGLDNYAITSTLWGLYSDQYSNLRLLSNTGPTTTFGVNSNAVFYDAGAGQSSFAGSGPVIIDASNWKTTGRSKGYAIINGFNTQGVSAGTILGRFSLLSLLHTYFRTGNFSSSAATDALNNRSIMVERTFLQDTTNVTLPPTVPVTPRDGTEVKAGDYSAGMPIAWRTTWKKWDGTPYTTSYSNTWKELGINVKYIVMVSQDNGTSWSYLKSDHTLETDPNKKAEPGVYDSISANYVLATVTPTSTFVSNEVVTDNVKMDISSFAGKDLLFRVEGHRFDATSGKLIPTNYSYHQRAISVSSS